MMSSGIFQPHIQLFSCQKAAVVVQTRLFWASAATMAWRRAAAAVVRQRRLPGAAAALGLASAGVSACAAQCEPPSWSWAAAEGEQSWSEEDGSLDDLQVDGARPQACRRN
jgi:hypothetical protein